MFRKADSEEGLRVERYSTPNIVFDYGRKNSSVAFMDTVKIMNSNDETGMKTMKMKTRENIQKGNKT